VTTNPPVPRPKLLLVGNRGGTNIAQSFARVTNEIGWEVTFIHAQDAQSASRVLNALAWRLADHKPVHLRSFSARLLQAASSGGFDVLLSTGLSPVTAPVLKAFREHGTVCIHYSTDDPWNPSQCARWHHRALVEYDTIFTPRRSNFEDFRSLGCRDVRYLPFGYDRHLFGTAHGAPEAPEGPDLLFVGGADPDRVRFMDALVRHGVRPGLVGGYWDTYPSTRPFWMGHKSPDELAHLTRSAKVNLCLVRAANRDGHVMRSFEAAAMGACMLVEDTAEHREIFGLDGECVVYFSCAEDAASRALLLVGDAPQRARLAAAVRARIACGKHSYRDRLQEIVQTGLAHRVHKRR
jgi:spore maturation protein CgeB